MVPKTIESQTIRMSYFFEFRIIVYKKFKSRILDHAGLIIVQSGHYVKKADITNYFLRV